MRGNRITLHVAVLFAVLLFSLKAWAVSPRAYVTGSTNILTGEVVVIDTGTNSVIDRVSLGASLPPAGLAIDPSGSRIYVPGDGLLIIDTSTNSVVASIPVSAVRVAVNRAGTRLYVTSYPGQSPNGSYAVSVVDSVTKSVIASVPVGSEPTDVVVNPAGTFVYVANNPNTVSVIDTNSNTVVATIPTPNTNPYRMAITPAGTYIYVTTLFYSTSTVISVIDTRINTVVASVPVGGSGGDVAVNPAGTRVYVTNPTGNSVSVIDTSTNSVIATIPVGESPSGVAVNPAGTYAYVSGYGVSVIDTNTNSVVATVPWDYSYGVPGDIVIGGPAGDFFDVPSNFWAFSDIDAIYKAGITRGCGSGDYCPPNNVTRDQMAAFIIRALYGESFPYTQTPYFSDVPSTDYFFKYIQKLKDINITTVSGMYDPINSVTRDQMAAFLVRALQVKAGQDTETFTYTQIPWFSDVPSTDYYFKYVQKLKDDSITTVTGTYNAPGDVTRDQMAAFIARAFLGMK